MESYQDSSTFQPFSAQNLEMLWFCKRAVHVGFTSGTNSPASDAAKRDLVNAQCHYKTRTVQLSEPKPQYWYWLRISSASFTLLLWLSSQFFTATFLHVLLQQQPPRGAHHVCHVGDMAAFQDEPIQLRLPFPGPNQWTTTPVFHRSLHRENSR